MISYCLIPFYNEEKRININKYIKLILDYPEIIFLLIDDGSTDSTLIILKNIELNCNNAIVKNNKINLGKAETIRIGFLEISSQKKYDFIGFFDCDFATPFSEYIKILNIADSNKLQLVFGSRVKLLGNKIDRNITRHIFSRIIVTIINSIFKLNIYDTQCGCKVFSNSVVDTIFNKKFVTKWLFDIEIFIRFNKKILSNFDIFNKTYANKG